MNDAAATPDPLTGPVTIAEFRARLAEMTDRVLAGEEIIVLRGTRPVARFAPIAVRSRKRLGTLKELLSVEELRRFHEAMNEPVSDEDRRLLEGEGTDDLGIWKGSRDGDAAGTRS